MTDAIDFEAHDAYRACAEMTGFIYGLEDRFPEDELPLLFSRLRAAAMEVGASLAAGIAGDGVDARGRLSPAASREARGRLGALRHFVLTARQQFFLDEHHLETFDGYHERIRAALAVPEGS